MLAKTVVFLCCFASYLHAYADTPRFIPAAVATTQAITASSISQTNATAGFTMSNSGYYYLSTDINYQPANTGTSAILINTSNVILDLAGRTITLGNAAASTAAIKVANNAHNVLIKNGTVTGFTEATTGALSITSGCMNIALDSLDIINCSGTGIYVTGCQEFNAFNIFSGNHTSTTATLVAGINLVSTNDIALRECDFSFISTNQSVAAAGANFDNCIGIIVQESRAMSISNTNGSASTSNEARGWSIVDTTGGCKNFYFYNTHGSNQAATAGIAYGFYVKGGYAGSFESCIADNNQSPQTAGAANTLDGLNAYGFYLQSANSVNFLGCKARRQTVPSTGTTAQYRDSVGFYSLLGQANKFVRCESAYNTCGGSFNLNTVPSGGGGRPGDWPNNQEIFYGYLFNPDTGSIPARDLSAYAAGFYLHQETGTMIRECSAFSNLATNTTGGAGSLSNNCIAVGIYLNRRAVSFVGTPPLYTVSPCQTCSVINCLALDNHSVDSTGLTTCRSIGIWEHAQVESNTTYSYNEIYSSVAPMGALAGSSSIYAGNVTSGHGQSWGRGNVYGGNIADPTLLRSAANTQTGGGFNFFVRYDAATPAVASGANYLREAVYAQQINTNLNNAGHGSYGSFAVWNWSFIPDI